METLPLSFLAACKDPLLGIPVWYKYLDVDTACQITQDIGLDDGSFWLIVAALIEILLRLAVYVAVVFIVLGGFRMITSSGSPDAFAEGRKTIVNAVIGLVIAIMASSVVSYIATQLESSVGATAGGGGTNALQLILNLAIRIGVGVTVIMVVLAGISFTTSNGDPAKIAKARSSIIYALIGLVVVIFAATIVALVGETV